MRIEPVQDPDESRFSHLSPTDKVMRKVAIVFVFVGVFIWFFRVVF